MSEQSDINQKIKESEYVATSATGNAAIYIYNYFGYREEVRVAPVKSDEAVTDDKLPSPYRGLFHFGPEDAEFFFGREVFVTELVQATQTHNFIPVLGASGSGKSSVVFAGLVPRLQQSGHWKFTHFRPGAIRTKERLSTVDPFYALATALVPLYEPNLNSTAQLAQASELAEYLRNGKVLLGDVITKIQYNYPQHRTLLIADQFEELYTLCQDEALRRRFLDMLLDSIHSPLSPAKSPLVLVMTIRFDFLGKALSYPPFADVMQPKQQVQIRPMNRKELLQVIEKPAQKRGVMFETGLAERILDEVENERGSLPLLEFALTSLWSKRQGNQLTHKAYEEIGEVEGALTKYAEQKYSEFNPNQQEQVRRIFIQLVHPGEGTEDTRRLAMKAELGETNWSLVKQLADARLVITSRNAINQETVEVVHEALIRNWSQLRQWMAKDRLFRAWQERLRAAMRQWEEKQRDEGALLRGKSLADAEDELQKRPQELAAEQEFIKVSSAQYKRQKRQRILIFGSISVAALLLATVAGVAVWRTNTAKANAQLRELAAASETLFQVYQKKKDDERFSSQPYNGRYTQKQDLDRQKQDSIAQYQDALVVALKAGRALQQTIYSVDLTTRFQVLTALSRAVYEGKFGIEIKLPECNFYRRISINMSIDRKMIACANSDGTVRLFDSITGKKLHVFKGNANWVNDVRFSPDGKMIASGTVEGNVNLWNRATKKVIKTLKGHLSEVRSLDFSPDGQTVAAGSSDGTITFWNTSTGQELKTLNGHSGTLQQIHFSPNGQMMVSVCDDNERKLWNLQTDKAPKILPYEVRSLSTTDISFSANNQTIIYSGDLYNATLWDIRADRVIKTIKGKIGEKQFFSPNGKIVASGVAGGGDNTIILRDASTGKTIRTLSAQAGKLSPGRMWGDVGELGTRVNEIGFSPNGKLIAVASADRTMTLWDSSNGTKLKTFQGLMEWTGNITFSPNGKLIATTGMDANNRESEVKLWDISTGKVLKTLIQEPAPSWRGITRDVRFSPDSQTIAVVSSDSTARLWNISTGQELNIPGLTNSTPLNRPQTPVQKGKIIASKMPDGRVRQWERSTGKELEPLYWQKVLVSDVKFSDDGKTVAVVDWDGVRKVRDVSTGKDLNSVRLNFPFASSISFSNDGSTIAAATPEGVKVWNASTGKEISTLKVDTKRSDAWVIERLFFSPDDKTIVTMDDVEIIVQKDAQKKTSEWSKNIELWNVQTGKTIETFKVKLNSANDVAFSPDNQTITFAKTDGSIELRDFSTGKAITTLTRHLKQVDRIDFSSDGKMLLSITDGGFTLDELKLWDLTTGQEIKTYKGSVGWKIPGSAFFLFGPDNKTIFLFNDGRVTLWNLDLEDLLKHGCNQAQSSPKARDLCNNNFRFW